MCESNCPLTRETLSAMLLISPQVEVLNPSNPTTRTQTWPGLVQFRFGEFCAVHRDNGPDVDRVPINSQQLIRSVQTLFTGHFLFLAFFRLCTRLWQPMHTSIICFLQTPFGSNSSAFFPYSLALDSGQNW